MGIFTDLFKPKPVSSNLIMPVRFTDNLWNQKWYSIKFNVAGVTFDNRQIILQHADKRGIQNIFFKKSTFENEPCIEVYVNNMMIGYVPKSRVEEFLKWSDNPCSIEYKNIRFFDGTYGITINVIFQNTIPISELNLISESEYLIVGTKFECRKNSKKMRKNVIKKMHLGDSVFIERYLYKGLPAYMIVDPKSKLDLGVLSASTAEYLSTKFSNIIFDAYLCEKINDTYRVHIKIYN